MLVKEHGTKEDSKSFESKMNLVTVGSNLVKLYDTHVNIIKKKNGCVPGEG